MPCLADDQEDKQNGIYFGLTAGASVFQRNRTSTVDVDFSTGGLAGGQLGYRLDNWRLEIEFEYQSIEGQSARGVAADLDRTAGGVGLYHDWQWGAVKPYLGGGLGVAGVTARGGFEAEDTAFAWHSEAGVEIPLSESFSVVPSYRYEATDTDIGRLTDTTVGHVFRIGLRYTPHFRSSAWDEPSTRSPDPYPYPYHYPYPSYPRDDDHHERSSAPPEKKERDRCGWDGVPCGK